MTLVSSRLSLIHRCTIERAAAAADDAWGNEAVPAWQPHLTDLACRFWVNTGGEQVREGTSVVPLQDMRMHVPTGTDVTEEDRVASVTLRGGTVQDGPLQVRAVIHRRDRIELMLAKVG